MTRTKTSRRRSRVRKKTTEKSERKRSQKAGLPPGTLVHVGPERTEKVRISVIDYSPEGVEEKEVASAEECGAYRDTPTVTWINVNGVHDVDLVREIGEVFGLHPLLLEDIVSTNQRPKAEDYGEYLFTVIKMLCTGDEGGVEAEQVSLVIGRHFLISFQEHEGDVFERIRDRIRRAKGRVRTMRADYLAYALIDAVVDNYFAILEGVGDRIENLEEELTTTPGPDIQRSIRQLKREAFTLRRSAWPLREVISTLSRGESPLIGNETQLYLRDVHDHAIQVADTVETFRDLIGGIRDTYMTVLSNKMNEVMKVLTIIATIFIPLTFIAGIYGMNFELMPELRWRYGYLVVIVLMAVVAVLMLLFFHRKGWIGGGKKDESP